jgi:DNA helicase-2/ATP-dependent DNA helicase PcrA
MKEFVQWIEAFRKEAGVLTLSQLTLALLAKTEYLQRLKEEGTDAAFSKMENIDELINVLMGLEQGEEKVSLESFLDKVSLVTDVDLYEDKGNRVSLMTLHCAKGLEFPVVFIVGIEEGLLPHYRRGEEIEDMEEERRLFYVGMTRAKERLFLSRAEERSTFGVGRANLPSRFLDELPVELMQFEEKKGKMESLFSQEAPWREEDHQTEMMAGDVSQEISFPERSGVFLSPEGFFPLKIGMRVRHSKFGEGRVKSVEGMDENQKATIVFGTVGSKRLKVCSAHLDILES